MENWCSFCYQFHTRSQQLWEAKVAECCIIWRTCHIGGTVSTCLPVAHCKTWHIHIVDIDMVNITVL